MDTQIATPALILDASASTIQIAILGEKQWLAFHSSKEEALEALFSRTESCLHEAGLKLDEIKSFIFCEGPGSILGIRLSAMAIRTWCTLAKTKNIHAFSYNSMHLALEIIKQNEQVDFPLRIVTESRMKRWNCLSCESAEATPVLKEISTDILLSQDGKLWYVPQRKNPTPPDNAQSITYDLKPYPQYFKAPLIKVCKDPDAFNPAQTEYKKWTAEPHRKQVIS